MDLKFFDCTSQRVACALLGGVAALALAGQAIAASSAPAWVSQIQPGTWAPVSLNTLKDVDPAADPALNPRFPSSAPWRAGEGQSGVLQDWTGGAFASEFGTHGALLVFGGGHNGYFGSEVYAFDLGTQQWTRLTNPYPGPFTWPFATGTYPDGSPVPTHTYDLVDYHPGTNSFVVMRGVQDGYQSTTATDLMISHMLDLGSGTWRRSKPNGDMALAPGSSCYDQKRDVFWILGPYTTKVFSKFDPNTVQSDGTYGQYTNYPGDHVDIDTSADCDPVRDLFVYTDFRNQDRVYARDLRNPSAVRVQLQETGTPPNKEHGNGWAWSQKRQGFLYWRRGAGVFEFRPDPSSTTGAWRWTNITTAANSVAPVDMVKDNGVYSRFRIAVLGDEEVALVINRIDGPVYAFRIPDGQSGAPAVSVSLSANPRTLSAGQSATLTWTSSNATSCTASGGWTGARSPNGSLTVGPLAATTTYSLECSGAGGITNRATVQISVATSTTQVNRAPTIIGSPATTAQPGMTYVFTPSASDPDGDTLSYSITGRPAWATFNSSNGRLEGTPRTSDVGTTDPIRISVTDGALSTALAAFSIRVEEASLGGTLSWNPPTVREDGQPLTDLAGYTIYFGMESGNYSRTIRLSNPGLTSYYVDGLAPGTYYFAVAGFDTAGNHSDLSNEVVGTLRTPSSVTDGGSETPSPDPVTPPTEDTTSGASAVGLAEVFALLLTTLGVWRNGAPARTPRPNMLRLAEMTRMALWNNQGGKATAAVILTMMAVMPLAPTHANDADFARRCSTPGVIKCVGFDSDAEVQRGKNLLPRWGTDIYGGSIDPSTKASGGGSLRFDIPENIDSADMAGKWVESLGDRFGARDLPRFSGKSKVYIQVRQRFSPEWTKGYQLGSLHFKQFAINNTDKCGDITIVTENSQGRGFPVLYSDCGSQHYIVKESGTNATVFQQGDYWCRYADQQKGDYSRCAIYRANQWITFYYEIEVGDENQANSYVRAYIQYEGQPMKKFIDFPTARFRFDRDGSQQAIQNISLLPYITRKSSSQPNERAVTWYDELIVSRQPIPAPMGDAPSQPAVDNVPPAPPSGLAFSVTP